MMKTKYLLCLLAWPALLSGCSFIGGAAPSQPRFVRTLDAFDSSVASLITKDMKYAPVKDTRPQGQGISLANYQICNVGQDSQGLRVTTKGSAIASGQISNFVAIVQHISSVARNTIDRTIYLHKVSSDTWTGETLIPLKTRVAHSLSGTEDPDRALYTELYADISSTGSGTVEIEIAPYESSQEAPVKEVRIIQVTTEHSTCEKLFSPPSDFRLTVYPGANFTGAERTTGQAIPVIHVNFATQDPYGQVIQYYKNEFTNRGFRIAKTSEPTELIGGDDIQCIGLEAFPYAGQTIIKFQISQTIH